MATREMRGKGMGKEDQAASLALSKELKELGVKQDGLFAWFRYKAHPPYIAFKSLQRHEDNEATFRDGYAECPELICDAYTVAELGEMLPGRIRKPDSGWCYLHTTKLENTNEWIIAYCQDELKGRTEVDARAKMLIHLIENGFIKVEEIGE